MSSPQQDGTGSFPKRPLTEQCLQSHQTPDEIVEVDDELVIREASDDDLVQLTGQLEACGGTSRHPARGEWWTAPPPRLLRHRQTRRGGPSNHNKRFCPLARSWGTVVLCKAGAAWPCLGPHRLHEAALLLVLPLLSV